MKEYILEKEHKPLGWAKVMATIYYEEAKVEAGRRALKENAGYRVREVSDKVIYTYSAKELKLHEAPSKERLAELFGRKTDEECW